MIRCIDETECPLVASLDLVNNRRVLRAKNDRVQARLMSLANVTCSFNEGRKRLGVLPVMTRVFNERERSELLLLTK